MSQRRVAMVTLGCARNDVDSDELAGRLLADGWTVVDDPDDADAVLVNTCGFVEAAKKDSIDTVLGLQDGSRSVVAVGCLAERYGDELAQALPEANAVLGFDAYPEISAQLAAVVAGEQLPSHTPRDRRKLLPISPVDRQDSQAQVPGHSPQRIRLETGPIASLKIASGCDRRCSFCAIPSFRGSFVSRRSGDVLTEARALVSDGVRELNLVSENSTSYGKDLGDLRLLETLLPELAGLHPDLRIRLAYLQPAEMRPGLVDVMTSTTGVARYFDLSFQHASPQVLRSMKRFGGIDDFLALVAQIRVSAPDAGLRTNVIVGFPGETEADLLILEDFLEKASLDAIGVFGYSNEDGTTAMKLPDHHDQATVDQRVARISELVENLMDERAHERVGSVVSVLVERFDAQGQAVGRAEHQGPEDGDVTIVSPSRSRIGEVIHARVSSAEGVDLFATEVDE
ncbi:MAG: 30S ribosomal protein S12 methylthiotransferase RimO [Candidatus Nanopelagicales bacterium]|nr:30S ribosomal protein S12 methylthiotransferase RimO [Candidatus Nanopelagicales bacterium]